MTHETTMAADRRFGGHQMLRTEKRAADLMISPSRAAVKPSPLLDQALAAEARALTLAAWHRERAASYLRWYDLPWAAGRYAEHIAAAEFQDAIAARHRGAAEALEGGRP